MIVSSLLLIILVYLFLLYTKVESELLQSRRNYQQLIDQIYVHNKTCNEMIQIKLDQVEKINQVNI